MRAVVDLAVELEVAAKGERAGPVRRARLEAVPGMFVLTSARSDDALLERENYAACCCAAQNLMLYLWRQGIGVKWTTGGITRQQRFYDLLGIDSTKESVVGLLLVRRAKGHSDAEAAAGRGDRDGAGIEIRGSR